MKEKMISTTTTTTKIKLLVKFSVLAMILNILLSSSGQSNCQRTNGTALVGNVQVYSTCNVPNSFALTFDDGPGSLCSELDGLLNNLKIQAGFFLNGNNFGCIYSQADCLRRRYLRGDLLGNHGWDHLHMSQLSAQEMHNQLSKVEDAMVKILGVKPLYFRPPYGEYNDLLLQVLGERGYKGLILWTDDSGDTKSPPPSPQLIVDSYLKFPPQSNILNHETKDFTVRQVIPTIVPELKSKGYNFIPVTSCLGVSEPSSWYSYVGPPSARDSSWTC